jgi:hypothetical protein
MTGERLAALMIDKRLNAALAKVARRYSKDIQDQEEYIQDAWIRIAEQQDDMSLEYYENQGRLSIKAAYYRKRYGNVQKKTSDNLYGISDRTIPRDAIPLGRGRYLCPKPEKLSSWYYDKEWEEYGLDKNYQVVSYYEIIVST